MLPVELLRQAKKDKSTRIATHGDADGIAAGIIRALETPSENKLWVASGGKFDMQLAEEYVTKLKEHLGVVNYSEKKR